MRAAFALILLPLLGLPAQEVKDPPDPAGTETAEGRTPKEGPTSQIPDVPSVGHDLHVSYGNLGVEGSLVLLQLRIFKDDLEEALGRLTGSEGLLMEASPEMDALFLKYLGGRFILEAGRDALSAVIVGSGYDELDREPVWSYQIRFDAPAPVRQLRITNTILFEVFGDQRNVVRVVKFPEERRSAYYFAHGEETVEITFGG